MTTNQGILSDLVNAGTDSILPPPIITRVTYQNNAQKVTVQAKAAPSALFYVFSKNVRISTCQANATGSVSDCGSEAFNLTYPAKLQVTQSNEKGTSDMSQTFVAEFPDPKIKGAGILPNSKRITAHGTAYPESVLLVYGNTTLLGTCDVDPDGIWSFVTDTDQKPGVYAIKVSQTFNIGSLGLHKEAEGPSVTVPTAPIKTRTTSLTKTSRTRTTSTLTKSLTRTATTTKVEIIDVNAHNLVSCATWNVSNPERPQDSLDQLGHPTNHLLIFLLLFRSTPERPSPLLGPKLVLFNRKRRQLPLAFLWSKARMGDARCGRDLV